VNVQRTRSGVRLRIVRAASGAMTMSMRCSTLVSKTHMPYALNTARKQRWQALFLDADYHVDVLPDYTLAHASNPFYTFQALPVKSRYQFMIDEAQYTIMGFIKGPVCRGQIALDVIEDQFWVWFIDPTVEETTHDAKFLAEQIKDLTLPDARSDVVMLTRWLDYAKLEEVSGSESGA
jgi:hypothetical protein